MKQIPNLFTLLNLIFGCVAVVYILQNGIVIRYDSNNMGQFLDIPEKIWMASLFIGLAAVVDFLDGFVARIFKATSAIGAQLDSLADVVSFGVAPSMIVYQFLRMSYAREEAGIDTSVALLMPAFLIAAAAAYRLSRFNTTQSGQSYFTGVPTPAAGLLVASFPLIYWHSSSETVLMLLLNKYVLYGFILLISWLMICRLPLFSLKLKNLRWQDNLPVYLLAVLAVVSAVLLQWLAVPLVFIAYIILSLIFQKNIS